MRRLAARSSAGPARHELGIQLQEPSSKGRDPMVFSEKLQLENLHRWRKGECFFLRAFLKKKDEKKDDRSARNPALWGVLRLARVLPAYGL